MFNEQWKQLVRASRGLSAIAEPLVILAAVHPRPVCPSLAWIGPIFLRINATQNASEILYTVKHDWMDALYWMNTIEYSPRSSPLYVIGVSLGPPKSSTQTASRSLQPFLQGLLGDRPTDHATRSVTIDGIYIRSTAMWSSNNSVGCQDSH